MIHDVGYGYIVASRIRKMSNKLQQQILDPKDYIEIPGLVEYKGEPEKIRYKILEHENFVRGRRRKTL